jgi:hypothetical protein
MGLLNTGSRDNRSMYLGVTRQPPRQGRQVAGNNLGAVMRFSSKAKRVAVVLFASLTLAGTSACAAEYRAPQGNCSPSYNPHSQYGNFSAQQTGPGQSIQWGAYPNSSVKATRFVVDVYVGSNRFDHKDQTYAPHGSVPATAVKGKRGQSFSMTGTAWDGSKNTLTFSLRCTIA